MITNDLIQRIDYPPAKIKGISVYVLRLDMLHPIVSGNKLFKLKYYLESATSNNKGIVTFGGPYSNHLVATAFAGKMKGIKTMGYVRGERPASLSETLLECLTYDMELNFVSREDFSRLQHGGIEKEHQNKIIIPYGGYGTLGALGAKEILDFEEASTFDYILGSCGSGTMAAGLIASMQSHQQLFLVSAIKNNFSINDEIISILDKAAFTNKSFTILHDYHFGGFAKKTNSLCDFMNAFYTSTGIPTDFVYTGKLFYAMDKMITNNELKNDTKLLVIHSGGLQGNRSLKNNELIF